MNSLVLQIRSAATPILMYLGIAVEPFFLLSALIFLDIFTGVGRSLVLKREITSLRARIGFADKMLIFIIVLTMALLLKALEYESEEYMRLIILIITLIEGYSVLGNIVVIHTKEDLTEELSVVYVVRAFMAGIKKIIDKISLKDITNKL